MSFFFEIFDSIEEFVKDRDLQVHLPNKVRFVLAVYNREMEKARESGTSPELNREKLMDIIAYHFEAL